MDLKFVKGLTADEKFKSIDNMLGQLRRRSKPNLKVAIPPIPVTFAQNKDGAAMFIAPAPGVIKGIVIRIPSIRREGAVVNMKIVGQQTTILSFETKREQNAVSESREVEEGTLIVVEARDLVTNESVGAYVAISWLPVVDAKASIILQRAWEEIENAEETGTSLEAESPQDGFER